MGVVQTAADEVLVEIVGCGEVSVIEGAEVATVLVGVGELVGIEDVVENADVKVTIDTVPG